MQQPLYPGAPVNPATTVPMLPVFPEREDLAPVKTETPPDDPALFDALAKDMLPDRFVYGAAAPADERADASLSPLARMADEPSSTDVLGSYTGMARDGGQPVQDADDL